MFHSCSAVLNGELFVFGGAYNGETNYAKQISKVSGCELKRIGDLNYDFEFGTCSTFRFPEERILMCFGNSFNDGCESFDGAVFHNHQNSRTNHYITTLTNFNDSPLAVGDWTGSGHSEAEVFNIAAKIWTEVAKYPYHPDISNYATVTTSKGALIIGGLCQSCGSKQVATVASYNEDGWNQLDDLQSIRAGHRAIVNDDKVFIVGGDGTKYTEIWTYKNGKRHVELAVPQLYDFADYPELSLVDINFCVRP